MYCINCGTQLVENSKICHNCGATVVGVTVQSPALHTKTRSMDKFNVPRIKKKVLVIIAALCLGALILGIVVTQSKSNSKENSALKINTVQTENTIQSDQDLEENTIDGFEFADYDKFNSPKSENGLGGTKVYFDGVVGSVHYAHTDLTIPGSNSLFLSIIQEDGNEWLVYFEPEPATNRFALDNLSGSSVRVYGVYDGLSIAYKKPIVHIYYEECCIEDKSNSVRYKWEDLSKSASAIIDWCDENDSEICFDEIDNPENECRFCKSTGIVERIDSATEVLCIKAECSDETIKEFTIDMNETYIISSSINHDSLCEGDKVNIYYVITYEDELALISIVPIEEPETFENNKYYEVIESGKFKYGDYTYVVFRVKAKKNGYIYSQAIAYDANGDVIGKESDEVWLSEGQTNMFYYFFREDVSMDNIDFSSHVDEGHWIDGDLDAVEMQKWNKKGEYLYITLEQTGAMGDYSKLRVLLYKNGKMVGLEELPFCVYAENLTGVGSTDVMKIWIYRCDFDDIEVAYDA